MDMYIGDHIVWCAKSTEHTAEFNYQLFLGNGSDLKKFDNLEQIYDSHFHVDLAENFVFCFTCTCIENGNKVILVYLEDRWRTIS